MRKTIIPLIAAATIAFMPAARAEKVVEADNGEIFRIMSVRSIDNHWRGGDKPYALVEVANEDAGPFNLVFDCEGHYAVADGQNWRHVPSRSVLAGISKIACKSIGM